jgi:hypothetical protein
LSALKRSRTGKKTVMVLYILYIHTMSSDAGTPVHATFVSTRRTREKTYEICQEIVGSVVQKHVLDRWHGGVGLIYGGMRPL